jgi:hypothetical protein
MKTDAPSKKPTLDSKSTTKLSPQQSKELKTDPMSEKDDVKKAEENLKESQKKNG